MDSRPRMYVVVAARARKESVWIHVLRAPAAALLLLCASAIARAAQLDDSYVGPVPGETWTVRKVDAHTGLVESQRDYRVDSNDDTTFWVEITDSNGRRTWANGTSSNRHLAQGLSGDRARVIWHVTDGAVPKWPVKVGDEWKGRVDYKFPTSEGYNEGTFRVEALETIDIPAGRFEAFRVVMRGFWTVPKIQSSTGRTGGLQEVTWYDRVSRRMLRRETIVRFDSSIKTVIFNREELMRTNVPSR